MKTKEKKMKTGMMSHIPFLTGLVFLVVFSDFVCMADAAVYYIRPDGGDTVQCTGLSDLAYPGSGTGMDCAWDHPFRALPPEGTPRITGGDTLLIGSSDYRVFFHMT